MASPLSACRLLDVSLMAVHYSFVKKFQDFTVKQFRVPYIRKVGKASAEPHLDADLKATKNPISFVKQKNLGIKLF